MELPRIKPSEPARLLIRSALSGAIARIQANDQAVHRGEVEGVHRLRTSTRRLRGELHAFRKFIDPVWREPIEDELKWLAGELGEVRDLDVLDERLRAAAAKLRWDDRADDLPHDETPASALAPLFQSIRDRHALASAKLREALQGDRYARLVWAIDPALQSALPIVRDKADMPCREALPPIVQGTWKGLKRKARALSPDDHEEAFHDVRKRCKRARYTAELVAPALGRKAGEQALKYIRLVTRAQDILGEHQDASVAIEEIERVRDQHAKNRRFVLACELLIEDQREAARSARESFFQHWKKFDRKRYRRWMNP
ncbi:MAG: hypothetical protein ABS79_07925 [Planctomycetes bacterium SCN 63-9]|nr:MAG: hypothetical protein ABS79_07925 [Planctomycetes bacterium SCN 63-9]